MSQKEKEKSYSLFSITSILTQVEVVTVNTFANHSFHFSLTFLTEIGKGEGNFFNSITFEDIFTKYTLKRNPN